MSIRWQGMDALVTQMGRLRQATPRQVGGALYREGERIMRQSKDQHVPVDLGTLRASGHVRPPEQGSGRVFVTLGFGGAAAAYALAVHEAPDGPGTPRSWRTAGHVSFRTGGPKYLERPVRAAQAGLEGRLAADIR